MKHLGNFGKAAVGTLLSATLWGCGDSAPKHYYVLCDDTSDGWKLVDTKRDDNGYLIACTFQSPDKSQVRTDMCTASGCD